MSVSGTPESEEALVSSHMEQEWDTWSRKECLNSPLDEELFPSTHRKVWIKLFLMYNTPIPSSAAVERLFSTASDIIRKKRSSLKSENFVLFLFLKKMPFLICSVTADLSMFVSMNWLRLQ